MADRWFVVNVAAYKECLVRVSDEEIEDRDKMTLDELQDALTDKANEVAYDEAFSFCNNKEVTSGTFEISYRDGMEKRNSGLYDEVIT